MQSVSKWNDENKCKQNRFFPKTYQRAPESKIVYHTYQVKDERVYRVVFHNLHHTILMEVEEEIAKHAVCNVLNIRRRKAKEPLSLYPIDLEPK